MRRRHPHSGNVIRGCSSIRLRYPGFPKLALHNVSLLVTNFAIGGYRRLGEGDCLPSAWVCYNELASLEMAHRRRPGSYVPYVSPDTLAREYTTNLSLLLLPIG